MNRFVFIKNLLRFLFIFNSILLLTISDGFSNRKEELKKTKLYQQVKEAILSDEPRYQLRWIFKKILLDETIMEVDDILMSLMEKEPEIAAKIEELFKGRDEKEGTYFKKFFRPEFNRLMMAEKNRSGLEPIGAEIIQRDFAVFLKSFETRTNKPISEKRAVQIATEEMLSSFPQNDWANDPNLSRIHVSKYMAYAEIYSDEVSDLGVQNITQQELGGWFESISTQIENQKFRYRSALIDHWIEDGYEFYLRTQNGMVRLSQKGDYLREIQLNGSDFYGGGPKYPNGWIIARRGRIVADGSSINLTVSAGLRSLQNSSNAPGGLTIEHARKKILYTALYKASDSVEEVLNQIKWSVETEDEPIQKRIKRIQNRIKEAAKVNPFDELLETTFGIAKVGYYDANRILWPAFLKNYQHWIDLEKKAQEASKPIVRAKLDDNTRFVAQNLVWASNSPPSNTSKKRLKRKAQSEVLRKRTGLVGGIGFLRIPSKFEDRNEFLPVEMPKRMPFLAGNTVSFRQKGSFTEAIPLPNLIDSEIRGARVTLTKKEKVGKKEKTRFLKLKPNVDFTIHYNPKTGSSFITIKRPQGFRDGELSAKIEYNSVQSKKSKFPNKHKLLANVDLEKLKILSDELKKAEFTVLTKKLDRLIAKARRKNKSVHIRDIQEIFIQASTYSFRSEDEFPIRQKAHGKFSDFSGFLNKKGRFCGQCDSGNQLFTEFLKQLYEDHPEVKIETAVGFKTHRRKSISAADLHAKTYIRIKGYSAYDVDATPGGRFRIPKLGLITDKLRDGLEKLVQAARILIPKSQADKEATKRAKRLEDQIKEIKFAMEANAPRISIEKLLDERWKIIDGRVKELIQNFKKRRVPISDLRRQPPISETFKLVQYLKELMDTGAATARYQFLPNSRYYGIEAKDFLKNRVLALRSVFDKVVEKAGKAKKGDRYYLFLSPLVRKEIDEILSLSGDFLRLIEESRFIESNYPKACLLDQI